MKNQTRFFASIIIFFIFTFPSLINTDQITIEKPSTSNYCGCKSKPDYYIQVSLREIYVTVKDKDGKHIKDLKPSEFKLWEDDVPQKIIAVDKVDFKETSASSVGIEERKALEIKPARYFALVIGNVPERDIQKEKSKEAIRNFINNNIGPSDNVSLYIMNQSSLERIASFTVDPKQSKEAVIKYLDGDNFGGRGFTSTHRGSLSRSMALDNEDFDDRLMRNMEFMNIAKYIESLCSGLQYISGKKDIILFSEGIYFDPDFSKDMKMRPQNYGGSFTNINQLNELRKYEQAKLGPTAATLMARLMDLKKAFVKYDIALQVIDLGEAANALVDIGERHMSASAGAKVNSSTGDITTSDSPTDFERKRTQMLQTISESSGGNYYQYSTTSTKLNKYLESVDYNTSFYYIVSYTSSEENDPDDYLPIKIEVSRDGALLEYKKGIVVPENFENLNEKEQNAQLNFISQSTMLYNMISICSSVAVLPAGNNDINLVFSMQIPLDEIIKTDKRGNNVDLDIIISIFDSSNNVVSNLINELKVDIKRQTGNAKEKSLGLFCSSSIDTGDYRIRFFIRNKNNMLISSEEYKVKVPDFKDSKLMLSSPLIFNENKDVLTVNLDKYGKKDNSTEKMTALSSLPGVFTVSNEVKNNRKTRIGVSIKGLSAQDIIKKDRELITWEAVKPMPKGSSGEPPVEIPFKIDDIVENGDGIYLTLFELDISDLPPGYYDAVIKTAKDGLNASSSISLNVI